MKCCNCNAELIELHNWNNKYLGDVQRTYFETFTLFANRHKNAFKKGTGSKKVSPKLFVCRQCGKLEMYCNDEDLKTILDVENDTDYSVDNTSKDVDETNSIRRMSSLRIKAQIKNNNDIIDY